MIQGLDSLSGEIQCSTLSLWEYQMRWPRLRSVSSTNFSSPLDSDVPIRPNDKGNPSICCTASDLKITFAPTTEGESVWSTSPGKSTIESSLSQRLPSLASLSGGKRASAGPPITAQSDG